MPGTAPVTFSTMPVMPVPGWKVTSALVSIVVGGVPAWASAWERAIEKQVECAAAMSSSGLVRPFGSSAREAQVRLPMSPEVTAETFAYAAEACGWEEE